MVPRISIAMRLQLILGLAIAGMLISNGILYRSLSHVAIHGPVYRQIVEGKDLIADILPPPEYIVESHLIAHELVLALQNSDPGVKEYADRLMKLKGEFLQRHEYWSTELKNESMRPLMLESLYDPAVSYFGVVEDSLLPACEQKDVTKAKQILRGPLDQHYTEHRQAVNTLTELATQNYEISEQMAKSYLNSAGYWSWAIVAGTIAIVGGFGFYIIRCFVAPLRQKAHVLCNQSRDAGGAAQSISASVRQLDDSIREISQNTHHAETICVTARTSVDRTCTVLNGLSGSSHKIGEVIQLIQRITHQTNLLALNATIEAARAGEAGLGFAVVAREVKELASQTNHAAGSIIEHIEAIQTETNSALASIEMVNEVVAAIHESQTSIASAVTQQSNMTIQLARNVEEMASVSRLMTNTASDLLTNRGAASGAESSHRAGDSLWDVMPVNAPFTMA